MYITINAAHQLAFPYLFTSLTRHAQHIYACKSIYKIYIYLHLHVCDPQTEAPALPYGAFVSPMPSLVFDSPLDSVIIRCQFQRPCLLSRACASAGPRCVRRNGVAKNAAPPLSPQQLQQRQHVHIQPCIIKKKNCIFTIQQYTHTHAHAPYIPRSGMGCGACACAYCRYICIYRGMHIWYMHKIYDEHNAHTRGCRLCVSSIYTP